MKPIGSCLKRHISLASAPVLAFALFLAWGPTAGTASEAGLVAGAAAPAWIEHPSEPFAIMATEVTVSHFRGCVEAGACAAESVDPSCNYGIEGRDDHPINCVTHIGSEQFCASQGGRLCTQDEWLAACRGTDDRSFPYGNEFDLSLCNSQSNAVQPEGRARTTVPVGSMKGCIGGLPGLYDMGGNVGEWIADCKGTYCKFRGGGYMSNDPIEFFAGCKGVCSGNQETFQSGVVGIRCCRDEVAAPAMSRAPDLAN